jgi:hypothetical protein
MDTPLTLLIMKKWFNTASPCKADIHYMLPEGDRLPELEQLIAQRNYFVIHAPRQVGKTIAILFGMAKHYKMNQKNRLRPTASQGDNALILELLHSPFSV